MEGGVQAVEKRPRISAAYIRLWSAAHANNNMLYLAVMIKTRSNSAQPNEDEGARGSI